MQKLILFIILFLSLFVFSERSISAQTMIDPDPSQNAVLLDWNHTSTPLGTTFGRPPASDNDIGFKYIPATSQYVCQIDIALDVGSGSPTDTVSMRVYSGGTTLTNGTLMWTMQNVWRATDFGSDVYASYWYGTFAPPGNCFGLLGGSTYWFVLHRTGSTSNTQNWQTNIVSGTMSPSDSFAQVWGDQSGAREYSAGVPARPQVTIYGISDGSLIDQQSEELASFCASTGLLIGTCNMFSNLFIPNFEEFSDDFNDLEATLSAKAPFAYIDSALSLDFSLSPSATTSPDISIPIQHTNSNISSLIPTSLDWSDADSGGVAAIATNAIRNVFLVLLWIAFIFFLVTRFKDVF